MTMDNFPGWFNFMIDDSEWYEFCDPYLMCVKPLTQLDNTTEYYIEIWEHPAHYPIDARSDILHQQYGFTSVEDAIIALQAWDGTPSETDWIK